MKEFSSMNGTIVGGWCGFNVPVFLNVFNYEVDGKSFFLEFEGSRKKYHQTDLLSITFETVLVKKLINKPYISAPSTMSAKKREFFNYEIINVVLTTRQRENCIILYCFY